MIDLRGKKVVSSEGDEYYGKFVGWVSRGGHEVGIRCHQTAGVSGREERVVGWGDSIEDLLCYPSNIEDKDVILVNAE